MRRLAFILMGVCACGGNQTSMPPPAKQILSIAITPEHPTLAAGTTRALMATATYNDGSTGDVTQTATWRSSVEVVATAAGGTVTGASPGTATILASEDNATGIMNVTVTDAVLTSIAITPPVVTLAAGTSKQLTATGTFSNATTQDLTTTVVWASSDPAVHVTAGGLVSGATVGDGTITATASGIVASSTTHVTAAELVSIDVSPPNAHVAKGLDRAFTAAGHFTDGSVQDLTTQVAWTSSDDARATIAPSGLAHAAGLGDATITATSGSIHGETVLSVTAAELVSIAVTSNPSGPLGFTQAFHATGTFTDGSTQDLTAQVTWASSDPSVATVSNASGSNGVVTTLATGPATISASLSGVTASTGFTVTAAVLVSITVTPDSQSIPKGIPVRFAALGTFSDGSTSDLTTQVLWQSDSANAPISNAPGSQGQVATLDIGSATITASASGVAGSTGLTVTPAELVSIAVTPATQTFPYNPSVPIVWAKDLTATGTFTDASTVDLTRDVAWSTSDANVVYVEPLPPVAGLELVQGLGSATISATKGSVVGTSDVSVVFATFDAVTIAPVNPRLEVSHTLNLTATGTFSNGQVLDVTTVGSWSSSNELIASADLILEVGGGSGQLTVTGNGNGMATIRFSYGVEATTLVTVFDHPTIEVTFTGDAFGEVAIVSDDIGFVGPVCTASCTAQVSVGMRVSVYGATPNGHDDRICTGPGNQDGACRFTVVEGVNAVSFRFTTDSTFTRLLTFYPNAEFLLAADFDDAGNLIVGTSSRIFKLDPSGATLWTAPFPAKQVRTGPAGTIYVISTNGLVKLDASGAVLWGVNPIGLEPNLLPGEFAHHLAVSDNGDVAVRIDSGAIALYDTNGNLMWTTGDTSFTGCVTFDSQGAVWAAAEDANPDELDAVGIARDGTLINRLHPLSGYHGMVAVDDVDHIITESSGHGFLYNDRRSQADVADSSSSVATNSSSYVDIGLVVKGANSMSLVSDQSVSSCGALNWSCFPGGLLGPLGVRAVDLAVDRTTRRAIVGTYTGLGAPSQGLVKVFGP